MRKSVSVTSYNTKGLLLSFLMIVGCETAPSSENNFKMESQKIFAGTCCVKAWHVGIQDKPMPSFVFVSNQGTGVRCELSQTNYKYIIMIHEQKVDKLIAMLADLDKRRYEGDDYSTYGCYRFQTEGSCNLVTDFTTNPEDTRKIFTMAKDLVKDSQKASNAIDTLVRRLPKR